MENVASPPAQLATVTIPGGIDIGACTAKESSRYAIAGTLVRVRGECAVAVATDGRCVSLTRLEALMPGNWEGIVPTDALPSRTECTGRKIHPRTLTLNGTVQRTNAKGRTVTLAPLESTFPTYESVIPEYLTEDCTAIRLNLELLSAIAHAIASPDESKIRAVTVLVPHKHARPIGVIGNHGIGVFMPIVHSGNKEECDRFNEQRTSLTK
jgi:DNA polymerase III sliding clamp (beta) subunit (PCNA family)